MPAILQLGHRDGNVTTVGFPFEPDHDEIEVLRGANPDELNNDPADLAGKSLRNHRWLHSLPGEHQPYFTHLLQVDDLWPSHGQDPPVWVACADHPALEEAVSRHFSGYGHTCEIRREDPPQDPPSGGPEDGGGPDGPPPAPAPSGGVGAIQGAVTAAVLLILSTLLVIRVLLAGFTNDGKDLIARAIGDAVNSFTGSTTSAPTATTVTNSGASFPASSAGSNSVHQGGLVGHMVFMATAYGVVISNTATVLTIDMWHTIGAPDTAATTPSTGAYYVAPGQAPAIFTGISVATRAFNGADQFLSNDGTTISELWFSGGGLKRKIATWAHTTGTNTFTLTTTWTANGSDTLPQTIAKWGAFAAEVTAAPAAGTSGPMLFNTNLASTATLAAVGDNVTTTDTTTET